MLTLLCYAKAATGRRWLVTGTQTEVASPLIRSLYYWLAVVFFALGLMSKPMLVTLPFVLLLLDYWPLGRVVGRTCEVRNGKKPPEKPLVPGFLILEKIPFLLLSAAACVVTVLVQRNSIASVQAFDLSSRIGNALVSYVAYVWQMIYPVGLAVFYPHPENHLSPGRNWVVPAGVMPHYGRSPGRTPTASLPAGGLAVVSGDAGACHRPPAGRRPGQGGSLHLPPANRIVCSGNLGGDGAVRCLAPRPGC